MIDYSYCAIMTMEKTPTISARTSFKLCQREEPSNSSGITDTVAM